MLLNNHNPPCRRGGGRLRPRTRHTEMDPWCDAHEHVRNSCIPTRWGRAQLRPRDPHGAVCLQGSLHGWNAALTTTPLRQPTKSCRAFRTRNSSIVGSVGTFSRGTGEKLSEP